MIEIHFEWYLCSQEHTVNLPTDVFAQKIIAVLAQLVEHITRNDEVVGSIPTNGSKIKGLRNLRNPFFSKNSLKFTVLLPSLQSHLINDNIVLHDLQYGDDFGTFHARLRNNLAMLADIAVCDCSTPKEQATKSKMRMPGNLPGLSCYTNLASILPCNSRKAQKISLAPVLVSDGLS